MKPTAPPPPAPDSRSDRLLRSFLSLSIANPPLPPPPPPLFSKLRADLMAETLARSFPDLKSAGRCKLVSKQWGTLIAGTSFKHRFASHRQLLLAREALSINPGNYYSAVDAGGSERWAEVISDEPRAFVYHNFLSKRECEQLITQAKPHMARSKVFSPATGVSTESSNRTSSQAWLDRSKVVMDVEKRIADFTFIPAEHGERLHVVHYEAGQKFVPHFDYTASDHYTKTGGPRAVSVLVYLSDVEEGGETVFPSAKPNGGSCGGEKGGFSVKPKMGDALVFWSMKPDGSLDPSSFHGGSPVIKGDKWLAIKFLRVNAYKVLV